MAKLNNVFPIKMKRKMMINEKELEYLGLKTIMTIGEPSMSTKILFKYLNGKEVSLRIDKGKDENIIVNKYLTSLKTKVEREKLNKKLNKVKNV